MGGSEALYINLGTGEEEIILYESWPLYAGLEQLHKALDKPTWTPSTWCSQLWWLGNLPPTHCPFGEGGRKERKCPPRCSLIS